MYERLLAAGLVFPLVLLSATTATGMLRRFILGSVFAANSCRERFVRDGLPRAVSVGAHLPMALVIAVVVVVVVVMTGQAENHVYAPLRIIFDFATVMLAAIPMRRGMRRGTVPATLTDADRNRCVAVLARREQRYRADNNERQQEQELGFHSQCLRQLDKSISSAIAYLTMNIDQSLGGAIYNCKNKRQKRVRRSNLDA